MNFQTLIEKWYDRAFVINRKIFRQAIRTENLSWYHDEENDLLLPEIVLNKRELSRLPKACQTMNGIVSQ